MYTVHLAQWHHVNDSTESVYNGINIRSISCVGNTRDPQVMRDGYYIRISHYRPKGDNLEQRY